MLQKYKIRIGLMGLVAMLFLLTGCGALGLANSAATPTPSQTLLNSANAMSQLKSVHFDLQATLNLKSSSSGEEKNGLSFNVTGNGDAAAPDQASTNVSLG